MSCIRLDLTGNFVVDEFVFWRRREAGAEAGAEAGEGGGRGGTVFILSGTFLRV